MDAVSYIDAPAWTPNGSGPRLIGRPSKHDVDYLPSWDHGEGEAPRDQEGLLDDLADIEGLMYTQDGMKLYELAWFSPGDVLEIGTYKGRSAALMSLALHRSGNPARIVSIDVDPAHLAAARDNLARLGLTDRVVLLEGSSPAVLRRLTAFRPGLVYVDGDHTFRGASADLRALEPIVPSGSVIVLHDYEGFEPDDPYWVQVAAAARESWLSRDCAFIGRFGLCGVFVRRSGGPPSCDPARPRDAITVHLQPPDARLSRAWSDFASRVQRSVRYRAHRARCRGRRS